MDTLNVAKIFLMRGDSVLLLLSKRLNKWHLPGGHLMEGESFSDGLKREVHEETGQHLKFYHYIQSKPNGRLYIGQLRDSAPITVSEEHEKAEWVKVNDLLKWELCKFTYRDSRYLQCLLRLANRVTKQ